MNKVVNQVLELEEYWKMAIPTVPAPSKTMLLHWVERYKFPSVQAAIKATGEEVQVIRKMSVEYYHRFVYQCLLLENAKFRNTENRRQGEASFESIYDLHAAGTKVYTLPVAKEAVLPENAVLLHRLPASAESLRRAGIIVLEAHKNVGGQALFVGWLLDDEWRIKYYNRMEDIFIWEQEGNQVEEEV